MCDYNFKDGEIIIREMMDALCLDMLEKGIETDSVTLYVGYSNSLHLAPARGSAGLAIRTNADSLLIPAVVNLYRRIVNPNFPIRRINITCNRVMDENEVMQLGLLEDINGLEHNRTIQKMVIDIKKKFGKNSILKGTSLQESATARERNRQIGGHKIGE